MIQLSSLSTSQSRPGPGAVSPPPAGAITITGFNRDRTIFDSGAGFGRSAATIPLAGTGTIGQAVEARALSVDDGGASSGPWTDLGVVGAGGVWSGVVPAPRNASWYRAEVRLKNAPAIAAQTPGLFGVGHVIAIWGQSEVERILSTFADGTTPPAITDAEAVQIIHGAAATPTRHLVSNAQPFTAAVAAMAATLISTRPGEKFCVIFHSVSGTDPRDLVDDGAPARVWASDKALHDFATADGQHVGLAAMSWFAAPSGLGASYGSAMFPLFAGALLDGTPVNFPATISWGAGNSFHADHWFGELYDYAHTKWVPYGPHRFDIDADMLDATHLAGGALQSNLSNKQLCRLSWRAMLASPAATMFLPAGLEPLNYVNGFDDGAGGWTDMAHPAGNTIDGTQAWARLTACAILEAAGLTGWAAPAFDQCVWEPGGAFVEVWSSAGAVTTTRLARGLPPLPASFPHWTAVMGFQINGAPATQTQIVAGRVRILPNSGSFTPADTVQFGEGGATGALQFPEDNVNQVWQNLPVVDVGAPGLTGIALRPYPDPAVFANTLAGGTPMFTTSAAGPYFVAPTNVSPGTSQLTFAGEFVLPALPATGSYILFSQESGGVDVEVLNNGNLRINIEDGVGFKVVNAHLVTGVFSANLNRSIVVSIDQAAQAWWLRVDGVNLVNGLAFTATGNGLFQSNREVSFLARSNATLRFVGSAGNLRVWYTATGNGAEPSVAPLKQVAGPAATANADSWKLGANAT